MFALGEAGKCPLQGLSCHLPSKLSCLQKSLGAHTVKAALLDLEHDRLQKNVQGLDAFKTPPGYMHEAPRLARRKMSNVKTKAAFRPLWDVCVTQWSELACVTPLQHPQVPETNEVLFCFHSSHFFFL